MVLRDVQNGSLEKWCESVELECVSGNVFLSQTSMLKTGALKLGMTDFFHVGELIPRPKTMEGMNEPTRARALHTMVTNTWMNANTEEEFCTAPTGSQFFQALRGNNGMTAGQKLLISEQMDCRGAGVVQTTSWALMAVVASMAPITSMASMAPMLVSMASMAWMDLMAPALKSVRESAVVWCALVASHSSYQALCFAFVQMSSWYSAADEFASSCHTEGE